MPILIVPVPLGADDDSNKSVDNKTYLLDAIWQVLRVYKSLTNQSRAENCIHFHSQGQGCVGTTCILCLRLCEPVMAHAAARVLDTVFTLYSRLYNWLYSWLYNRLGELCK